MERQQPERPSEIRFEAAIRIMTPPEQISIPIPLQEWNALLSKVESCRVFVQWWSIAYSIAFGVGATAGLSIAPIVYSDLPGWVLTLYAVVCSVGLTSGAILILAQRTIAKGQHSQIDSLLSDIQRTRDIYVPPPTQS